MTKTLYLMRHGQTLFNARNKIQGSCDSPLTELGINQAMIAAQYFDEMIIDSAHSSTSERACDTLELVTRNSISYTRHKGLKEFDHGTFEGESEDLNPKEREGYETFYLPYGGESSTIVRNRMKETITNIMETEGNDTVLIVSHGGAIMNFLSEWASVEEILGHERLGNCAIVKLAYSKEKYTFLELINLENI